MARHLDGGNAIKVVLHGNSLHAVFVMHWKSAPRIQEKAQITTKEYGEGGYRAKHRREVELVVGMIRSRWVFMARLGLVGWGGFDRGLVAEFWLI